MQLLGSWLGKTTNDFSLSTSHAVCSGNMSSNRRGEASRSVSASALCVLYSESCGVFPNRILPPSSGGQPRAVESICVVWRPMEDVWPTRVISSSYDLSSLLFDK